MEGNDTLKTGYERLAQLSTQVAEMYQTGSSLSSLGSAALELITIRNQFEENETNMDAKAYESVKKTIQELEKSIISIYMLSMIGEKRRRAKDYQLFKDYIMYER